MSKESLVFTLGVIVALTPLAGIPDDWKQKIFIGAGIVLVVLGYQLRRAAFLRSIETPHGERRSDAFVESKVDEAPPDFLTDSEDRFSV